MNDLPKSNLKKKPWVQNVTSMSASAIDRLVRAGRFPAPVKISANTRINYWLEHEVRQWIEEQVSAARGK